MRYKLRESPTSSMAELMAVPIKCWLALLCIGALGHRLNIPWLLQISYLDLLLMMLAWRFVGGNSPIVGTYEIEEVKGK